MLVMADPPTGKSILSILYGPDHRTNQNDAPRSIRGTMLQRGKMRAKAVDGPEMPIEETGRLG
jgi:hypothetical protein